MAPLALTPDRLAALLPRSGTVLIGGCSAESRTLAGIATAAGDALATTFTGIVVPGLNRVPWLPGRASRFETFFMAPEFAAAPRERVSFLPLRYTDILARWRRSPPTALMVAVSPPDADGWCSFGPAVDFAAELWPTIPIRIGHINPLLPRTEGPCRIPLSAFDAVVEAPEPPLAAAPSPVDPITAAIAGHLARFIGDGATLQTGVGKLPGPLLSALCDRRGLRIHSGLIGDGVLDLVAAGALDPSDVVAGVAIGSERLYRALPGSGFAFHPVSHTHDPRVIAAIPDFVSVNSALSVDLWGQAYAEATPRGWLSGTGGAVDFAAGARAAGSLRIVALPATAKGERRIGAGHGPVTLSRTDIDIVATEHGAADLRSLDHDARAAALIAIAAPEHREALARAWRDGFARF